MTLFTNRNSRSTGAIALACAAAAATLAIVNHVVARRTEHRVVFPRRSEQLADNIPGSVLQLVEGAGHMVHYAVPKQVAQAVESVAEAAAATNVAVRSVVARPRWGDAAAAA